MTIETPALQLAARPARRLLLQDLAFELLAEPDGDSRHGRLLIAVDGPTAVGKTTFADELALAMRVDGATVFRASMDDFLLPRARRYARGRTSPEGRYEDSYDYSLFRRVLVDPFLMAGSTGFVLAGFDSERDVPFESDWQTAPADAVVVVDGSFTLRPELRGIWSASIWLDADSAVRDERIAQRDGIAAGSEHAARYSGAYELYLTTSPRDAASLTIDNSDPDSPERTLAMARWAPQRADTLHALAEEIVQNYAHGRVIVAIDGADGAGKTVFADDLAEELRSRGHTVFRASVDDFHQPRALRYAKGRDSADGFYEDSYDYPALRRLLIEPFRAGGSTAFQTGYFDLDEDAVLPAEQPIQAPVDAFLILDGIFLLRPELKGIWNFTVWLDAPDEVRRERMVERDGSHPGFDEPRGQRYFAGQARYQREAAPRAAASAIIDNTDYDHPRRQFADSR